MAKMTLKIKVNDLHFQYQPKVYQNGMFGANLVILAKICECRFLSRYGQMTLKVNANDPIFNMMTSSNGNIFRVSGHFCGEFTGHRWIPRTKACDAELWFFYQRLNERLSKQSWVIWDAMSPIMTPQ